MEYGDWEELMERENDSDKPQVSDLHYSDRFKPTQSQSIH